MSDEAIREVEKWQRRFFLSFFVAMALLVLQIAFDLDFLDYPRAGAWGAAGVCSIFEGRARRQLGQDASAAVLRGLACFCFAILVLL